MKVDAFLEIYDRSTPVAGETQDATFRKTKGMDLLSFTFSPYTAGSTLSSGKDEEGKQRALTPEEMDQRERKAKATQSKLPFIARVSLEITKSLDNASPDLFQAHCRFLSDDSSTQFDPFESATLTVRKAAGRFPLNYLIVRFEHVYVVEYNVASGGQGDVPVETVKFCFEKCWMQYEPQSATGAGTNVTNRLGWDFVVNGPL